MQDATRSLEARLTALENQNRRLKRGGLVLAGAALLAGLSAFTSPRTCDIVSAERLVLRDHSGNQRLVMDAYRVKEPVITFKDKKGQNQAAISMNSAGGLDVSVFEAGKAKPANFGIQNGRLVLGSKQAEHEHSGEAVKEHGID